MASKLNRAARRQRAEETVRISTDGSYMIDDQQFDIASDIASSIESTFVISASEPVPSLVRHETVTSAPTVAASVPSDGTQRARKPSPMIVDVVDETTVSAIHRLSKEGHDSIGVLNFASARNAGGGFLRGSLAQEESLAISSSLYACQTSDNAQPYYAIHRTTRDCTYTDTMIYSPKVTFFRDNDMNLCAPVAVDVLTSCAVNAGVVRSRGVSLEDIRAINARRISKILHLFAARRCRVVVLGAFGCGVFKNSPIEMASLFQKELTKMQQKWASVDQTILVFDRVIFAIPGHLGANSDAFNSVFN
jgi:uncharacterized protein (TIGR02452 family)